MTPKSERVIVANEVLKSFAPATSIRIDGGYVLVKWTVSLGGGLTVTREKRWMTRGNDFFPVWYRSWCHGGTASTALSQLVRWIQGKTVLPLSSWIYWAGENCRLLRQEGDFGESALKKLSDAGYPETVPCVLCGDHGHIGDWWHLDAVVGPCCHMSEGCRQKTVQQ